MSKIELVQIEADGAIRLSPKAAAALIAFLPHTSHEDHEQAGLSVEQSHTLLMLDLELTEAKDASDLLAAHGVKGLPFGEARKDN